MSISVGDAISLIGNIKDGIVTIKNEIDSLKNIEKINLIQLPAYSKSMDDLDKFIIKINTINFNLIPEEHLLKITKFNNLKTEIQDYVESLKDCNVWSKKITSKRCCCLPRCWAFIKTRPSTMERMLKDTFNRVNITIDEFNNFQEKVFGTALRIVHPILRLVWIQVGGNDIENSTIPINLFIQSMYSLLKKEESNKIACKRFCLKIITQFVNQLDRNVGINPDGLISTMELDEFIVTPENSVSVKAMLGLVRLPDIDIPEENNNETQEVKSNETQEVKSNEINIELANIKESLHTLYNDECVKKLNITFTPLKITCSDPINIPICGGYGGDWPSQIMCDFYVPQHENKNENWIFNKMEFECIATDQEWGGSGQSNIRIQLNNNDSYPAFFINTEKTLNKLYTFSLGNEQVKIGDNIKLWLACPAWSGWKAQVDSITGIIRYHAQTTQLII